MAYDDSETVYHLTPGGWKTGDPPPGRVETWLRSSFQASGWSREIISWSCTWANPAMSRSERDAIRYKHREFMGTPGRFGNRETTIGEPL